MSGRSEGIPEGLKRKIQDFSCDSAISLYRSGMSQSHRPFPVDAEHPDNEGQSLDNVAFGSEVRQLRKVRGLTLAELADATGVSVSHLSAIERATVNPSLSVVRRIAQGLQVPTSWFFAHRPGRGELERAYVVRKQNRRPLNQLYGDRAEDAGYSDFLLSSSIGGGFHVGIAEYAPYSDKFIDELYVREGEQHALVLDGTLELTLGDEVIDLSAGDSFSYPAEIPHRIRNVSSETARLLWVNSPVILPSQAAVRSSRYTNKKTSNSIYKIPGRKK